MADAFPAKCPSCKKLKLRQDYSRKKITVDDGVIRSVGRQAEVNAKRDGKELTELKAEQMLGSDGMAKRKAPTPWWRKPGSKPLDVTKIKDVTKYIQTGEK